MNVTRLASSLATLAGLSFPVACASPARREPPNAGPSTVSEDSLPAELRRRTFDVVWGTVHRTFWDSAFAETEWRRIGERHRPRALNEADSRRFHAVLRSMLDELHRSHFTVLSPEVLRERASLAQRASGTIGVTVRAISGQLVVVRVEEGGPAHAAGLRPGDFIEHVEPAPGASARVDSASRSSSAVVAPVALARSLDGPASTSVRLYVRTPEGATHVIVQRVSRPGSMVRRRAGPIPLGGPPRYLEIARRRMADDIGYVRISAFVYGTGGRIQQALRDLARTRGLIVDLRGNSGGEDAVALQLANALVHEPATFMLSRLRNDTRIDRVRPVRDAYKGRVVILLDSTSSSASEQFAAGIQALGRARIIGERTRGRVLDARTMTLPTGGFFQYARGEPRIPDGTILEGRGVIPDVEVPLTIETLACRCDPQLQTALEFMRNSR